MPRGAALSEGSSGEGVNHVAAVRIRVTGTGSLKMTIYSMDDIRNKTLVPLAMQQNARFAPTRLVNFMEQRAAIELKTTEIDEKFRINRIVLFTKPVYTSYPGS